MNIHWGGEAGWLHFIQIFYNVFEIINIYTFFMGNLYGCINIITETESKEELFEIWMCIAANTGVVFELQKWVT